MQGRIIFGMLLVGFTTFVFNFFSIKPEKENHKPVMRIYSISVDNHAEDHDFFVDETIDIENALCKRAGRLYQIKKQNLHGKKATREKSLELLRKAADESASDDLVVVYIGTHGNYTSQWGFFWSAANNAVSGKEVKEILSRCSCRLILIVDTCHAAGMIEDWKDADPEKVFIITSSGKDDSAYCWGMSLPFLDAMDGDADANHDGVVTLKELAEFLRVGMESHPCPQTVVYSPNSKLDAPLFHSKKHLTHLLDFAARGFQLNGKNY